MTLTQASKALIAAGQAARDKFQLCYRVGLELLSMAVQIGSKRLTKTTGSASGITYEPLLVEAYAVRIHSPNRQEAKRNTSHQGCTQGFSITSDHF